MDKIYATLSADIVDSTSLSAADTIKLKELLEGFFPVMKSFCDEAWGRVVRGDSVECVIPKVRQSLRLALLLKCYVRTLELDSASRMMKKKGVRMALGLGTLRIADEEKGIIDGDAIYASGRGLDAMSDSDAVTFSIVSSELNVGGYAALSDMMGFVIDKATNKQCSVLYYLLRGYNQKKVAQMLSLEPPTVNQHVNAVGWTAIQRALNRFETEDFEKLILKKGIKQ